jgi:hypothetical protein
MKLSHLIQYSPEWWKLKAGKIGGTRFGQVISNRKNRLVYELMAETKRGYIEPDDFVNDDMQFGIDNERFGAELYEAQSGIKFNPVGMILSDLSRIHIASPDRVNLEWGIVLEIKCTQNEAIHYQRFFEGPESANTAQIYNYFAVSDDVKEVHWISYCPYVKERPIVIECFHRRQFVEELPIWREKVVAIEADLNEKLKLWEF